MSSIQDQRGRGWFSAAVSRFSGLVRAVTLCLLERNWLAGRMGLAGEGSLLIHTDSWIPQRQMMILDQACL